MKNNTPVETASAVEYAIKNRFSARAFLDKPVARETVYALLEQARWAPSGVNTQPWQVAVVEGDTLRALSESLLEARHLNLAPQPDYIYYPKTWVEPYAERRKACGLALYSALGIPKSDTAQRLHQWNLNYRCFGAPVALIIHLDRHLEKGSWLDTGFFIQNILLAATAQGLATCPQAALAEYPDRVRNLLQLSDSRVIVCGIALGYPDPLHPANQYRTERVAVEAFTTWYR